jgi:hypothetical protein
MPSSVFLLRNIGGRTVLGLPRTGSFPTETSDFEFAHLTLSESDDAKMIWWLFMAYFHRYEMLPIGTRSEVVLATLLIANHLRCHGWDGPVCNQSWPLHRRQFTEIAYARLCDIDKTCQLSTIEHAPTSHEWADAEAVVRHTNLMRHLTPMMQKLSDETSFNARRIAFLHNDNDQVHQNTFDTLHAAPQSHRDAPPSLIATKQPKRSTSFKNLFFFRRAPSA